MIEKYEYTRCRTVGHAWDQIEDDTRVRPMFGIAIQFRCIFCTTLRRDVVNPHNGELMYRSYKKPDGYKHLTLSRGEWRVLYIQERTPRTRRRNRKQSAG